jgi:peptide/nickel transport system substrate-binding protein
MTKTLCLVLVATILSAATTTAAEYVDPPLLADRVKSGEIPAVDIRLPRFPKVVKVNGNDRQLGKHGGTLNMLMARAKDVRMMVVYGYARLVKFDRSLRIVPDILQKVDVEEGRTFTFHLRQGHKWSDGHPFTAEDFRFFWEDVANNEKLSPIGPPAVMRVDGELPKFEVINKGTVR